MACATIAAFPAVASAGSHARQSVSFTTKAAECGACHTKQYQEWRYGAGTDLDNGGAGSYARDRVHRPHVPDDARQDAAGHAGETATIQCGGAVVPSPGVYTIRIEMLQDANRVDATLNYSVFMGSAFGSFVAN
jgi:hypothetical protein